MGPGYFGRALLCLPVGPGALTFAFRQNTAVFPPGVVVIGPGLLLLGRRVGLLLHLPALFHPGQAPARAVFAGADRLIIHQHKEGVGVRSGEHPQCNPGTLFDGGEELHFLQIAIGWDLLGLGDFAIDN